MCLSGVGTGPYDLSEHPVTGYRYFTVEAFGVTGTLRPQVYRLPWEHNPWFEDFATPDSEPTRGNQRGLYVYNRKSMVSACDRRGYTKPGDYPWAIWGRVVGTGYGIKHRNGWRLDSAFIVAVYFPESYEYLMRDLHARYPVTDFYVWCSGERRYIKQHRKQVGWDGSRRVKRDAFGNKWVDSSGGAK